MECDETGSTTFSFVQLYIFFVIQNWLDERDIVYDAKCTKAELLEIAFDHVPPKQYKTNEAADEWGVEIVRLPVKHCMLNPIELAWSNLKSYVRANNTFFRLSDIETLSKEYIAALDDCSTYFEYVHKVEMTFRKAGVVSHIQKIGDAGDAHRDEEMSD